MIDEAKLRAFVDERVAMHGTPRINDLENRIASVAAGLEGLKRDLAERRVVLPGKPAEAGSAGDFRGQPVLAGCQWQYQVKVEGAARSIEGRCLFPPDRRPQVGRLYCLVLADEWNHLIGIVPALFLFVSPGWSSDGGKLMAEAVWASSGRVVFDVLPTKDSGPNVWAVPMED